MNDSPQREGVLVKPQPRLSDEQVALVDGASRDLLQDPGLLCEHAETIELFKAAGATVDTAHDGTHVRIPPRLVDKALDSAPSRVVLGARNPDNRLILDADEPRVRFGTGSETNTWLDVSFDGEGRAAFSREPGSIRRLREAAHLCEHLEHVDFFIRCLNIQDPGITAENKDVNKFAVCLDRITKHVQADLTHLPALADVLKLGGLVAGGEEAFAREPLLSFITCVVKSPLQVVDETAEKLFAIARAGVPVVISSSPMGGTTAPIDEFGMVAQINAELLAGVTLHQLAAPASPVLYGTVAVRCRLDNLNDMYGVAEFNQYNAATARMARHYALPCYSTAGISDAATPGIQATFEKMLTLSQIPHSGAQYVHCAFGLLGRSNMFCPEQAILDDAHLGEVKRSVRPAGFGEAERNESVSTIRQVIEAEDRSYVYHLPVPSRERVYARYPLEHTEGGALRAAHDRRTEIASRPPAKLEQSLRSEVEREFADLLPRTLGERNV